MKAIANPRVRWAVVVGVLLALCGEASAARAPATKAFDEWYAVLIEKKLCGWMHATAQPKDGRVVTTEEADLALSRGGVGLRVHIQTRFVETADGQPVEAVMVRALGSMETKQTTRFLAKGTEITTEQGGRKQVQMLPKPEGAYVTPAASQQHVEQQIQQGAEEITFESLSPESAPRTTTTRMKRLGEENIEVFGKVVPAIAWQVTTSDAPNMTQKHYLSESGDLLQLTMELLPGMTVTVEKTDEALAKAKVNPPELVASTLVKPDKAITRARRVQSATYELSFVPGTQVVNGKRLALEIPQTDAQHVTMIGDGNRTARVVVELGRSGGSAKGAASPGPEYLKASPALDSEDPKVKQLLERAMRGAPSTLTAAEKGERLRQFVHRFIKRKDLSVGMATASEVARTAQGDCTEHAVLLAALLRAAEIPSRTVAGLIYVDEFLGRSAVFGYHMWAEAWIGGRWVDLDATLDDVPFDAAHIALDMSAMNDPLMSNDLVKLSALIGRVRVHVVQTK